MSVLFCLFLTVGSFLQCLRQFRADSELDLLLVAGFPVPAFSPCFLCQQWVHLLNIGWYRKQKRNLSWETLGRILLSLRVFWQQKHSWVTRSFPVILILKVSLLCPYWSWMFFCLGSIIRCMRRLEEVLRQMCSAAKAIGNTELENKFAEG